MFSLFIGEKVEYAVDYRDDYTPSQDEIDKKLSILERVLDLGISEKVDGEIKKELIKDLASYYKFEVGGDELAQSIATEELL